MKSFFDLFARSYNEMFGGSRSSNLRCMVTTALLIAVSMVIEMLTINLPFAKVNFAFIAVAAIGMLYGPSVAFFANGICDILGFIVNPTGSFLPVYTLIAMLQGLIYGIVLYRNKDNAQINGSLGKLAATAAAARIIDVLLINLVLNTAANLHYGFITADSLYAAISARFLKNALELLVDIPLLAALMPAVLKIFYSTVGRRSH